MPLQVTHKIPEISARFADSSTNVAAPTGDLLLGGFKAGTSTVPSAEHNYLFQQLTDYLRQIQLLSSIYFWSPNNAGKSAIDCPKGGIIVGKDANGVTVYYKALSALAKGFNDPSTDSTNWEQLTFSPQKYVPAAYSNSGGVEKYAITLDIPVGAPFDGQVFNFYTPNASANVTASPILEIIFLRGGSANSVFAKNIIKNATGASLEIGAIENSNVASFAYHAGKDKFILLGAQYSTISSVNSALASKANAADVNSALASKANAADVNSALASKANAADVNSALNNKMNSTSAAVSGALGFTPLSPVGQIIIYPTDSVPSGVRAIALQSMVALVSRSTYAALFAVIGTKYSAGDGSTTFGIPAIADGMAILAGLSGVGRSLSGNSKEHVHSASLSGGVTSSNGAHVHGILNAGASNQDGDAFGVVLGHNRNAYVNSTDAGTHTHNVSGTVTVSSAGTTNNEAWGIKFLIAIGY